MWWLLGPSVVSLVVSLVEGLRANSINNEADAILHDAKQRYEANMLRINNRLKRTQHQLDAWNDEKSRVYTTLVLRWMNLIPSYQGIILSFRLNSAKVFDADIFANVDDFKRVEPDWFERFCHPELNIMLMLVSSPVVAVAISPIMLPMPTRSAKQHLAQAESYRKTIDLHTEQVETGLVAIEMVLARLDEVNGVMNALVENLTDLLPPLEKIDPDHISEKERGLIENSALFVHYIGELCKTPVVNEQGYPNAMMESLIRDIHAAVRRVQGHKE